MFYGSCLFKRLFMKTLVQYVSENPLMMILFRLLNIEAHGFVQSRKETFSHLWVFAWMDGQSGSLLCHSVVIIGAGVPMPTWHHEKAWEFFLAFTAPIQTCNHSGLIVPLPPTLFSIPKKAACGRRTVSFPKQAVMYMYV